MITMVHLSLRLRCTNKKSMSYISIDLEMVVIDFARKFVSLIVPALSTAALISTFVFVF